MFVTKRQSRSEQIAMGMSQLLSCGFSHLQRFSRIQLRFKRLLLRNVYEDFWYSTENWFNFLWLYNSRKVRPAPTRNWTVHYLLLRATIGPILNLKYFWGKRYHILNNFCVLVFSLLQTYYLRKPPYFCKISLKILKLMETESGNITLRHLFSAVTK